MQRYLPLVCFVILIVAFRWVGSVFSESFPNFQPLTALFFCGVMMAKGWRSWAIPALAWLATYPIPALISKDYSYLALDVLLTTAASFAVIYFIGKAMATRPMLHVLAGAVVSAMVFHLITNGAAWLGNPAYAKNLEGFVQSVWNGPVGSPIPSWVFLRNMVAANLLFTAIFLCTRFALPKISPAPVPHEAR